MRAEALLQQDLDEIQKAVKMLGSKVGGAGVDWKDEKYAALTASLNQIASASKQVLLAGSKCGSAARKFRSVEEE